MKKFNPFTLKGYRGGKYFCDREDELKNIVDNLENGTDITLYSIRRTGKTGLIYHIFNHFEEENEAICIYIDIFSTQNKQELISLLASAIFDSMKPHKKIANKFIEYIKKFSPVVSFDPLTGTPELSMQESSDKQHDQTLATLFEFLDKQNKQVIVAIDEFQQIANYPEKNIEAIFRTIVQKLTNVNFIFSGSHKHLLLEIFSNAKRPFFSSTNLISLGNIPIEKYKPFIIGKFEDDKRKITEEAVDFILSWTRTHTYYTQAVCNKVYATLGKKIVLREVQLTCANLLGEKEHIYYQYRNLLTDGQWEVLKAIAKEDKVRKPTAFSFIAKYKLGNTSSVRRSLLSLIDKEMVIEMRTKDDHYYMVYDCFLSRWLARM